MRYGDELDALAEEIGLSGRRVVVNLLVGAAGAWLHPVHPGDATARRHLRLQATLCTVFTAWALAFLAAAGFNRAVYDGPLFAPHDVAGIAFFVTRYATLLIAACMACGGFAYWLAIVPSAIRSKDRAVLLPAVAPAAVVAAWGLVTLLTALAVGVLVGANGAWLGSATPLPAPHGGRLALALLVLGAYLCVTCIAAASCVISASTALRRSSISTHALKPGVALSAVASAGIAAQTAAATICFATIHWDAGLLSTIPQAAIPLGLMLVASAVATTSSIRGLRVV